MGCCSLICLLALSECVWVSVDADTRELGIIFDSSLSHEGVLVIPGFKGAWSCVKTVTHPDSALSYGCQSCFVYEITDRNFICQKSLFVWLQSQNNNINQWLRSQCWHLNVCVSIQYLKPEHWHSCSELQPEHKQRKEQSDSKAERRREGERAQRGKQLEQS